MGANPILLWRPLSPDAKPEPVAHLTYGEHVFAIPYTLIRQIEGAIAMDIPNCSVFAQAGLMNARMALVGLANQMGHDASPLTAEQIAFYASHNIPVGPAWPAIQDYSA